MDAESVLAVLFFIAYVVFKVTLARRVAPERRPADLEPDHRKTVAGHTARFLEAAKRDIDEVLRGRPSRLIGTPPSVHLALLPIFVAGAVGVQVPRLSPWGRGVAGLLTLAPIAAILWSLLRIERLTLERHGFAFGRWLGRSRWVAYDEVKAVVLRIEGLADRNRFGTRVYKVVVETPDGPLAIGAGRDECILVGRLFPRELRRVESTLTRQSVTLRSIERGEVAEA